MRKCTLFPFGKTRIKFKEGQDWAYASQSGLFIDYILIVSFPYCLPVSLALSMKLECQGLWFMPLCEQSWLCGVFVFRLRYTSNGADGDVNSKLVKGGR